MSVAACADLVRRGDPDRFLSAMTAPPDVRATLFPLYAFNLEVARAPWLTQEPMIAEMRLQWWRDAIAEIATGRQPRAHEVVMPLQQLINRHQLPAALFDQLIAARRWDIFTDPFDSAEHFERHIDQTSGNLMWLSAMALGAPRALERPVRDVAFAHGVANWLRAAADLQNRGRRPLFDSRPAAIRTLARAGLARIRSARRADFGAAMPALRAAWRAKMLLRQAVANPDRVAAGHLGCSEFRRRAGLLWKTTVGGW